MNKTRTIVPISLAGIGKWLPISLAEIGTVVANFSSLAHHSGVGDVVAMIKGEGKILRRKEKRLRIEQIRANLGLSDYQRTPVPGETLRDFYKRTNMWQLDGCRYIL